MPSSTSTFEAVAPNAAARGIAGILVGFVGGIFAALVALELALRVLPVATSTETGYYFDPMLLTYPAHHTFVSATGWDLQNARRNRANNFGYVADHDFVPNPRAVAVIGDSFVEGSMLDPRDRFAAQIERRLHGRPAYAMGSPGTSLLDYAERVRFGAERFGIRDFVLLIEHGDIAQSLCGSGNVEAQCLDRRTLEPRVDKKPPPGLLKRVLRQSALAQYLFSQLKLDPVTWVRSLLSRPAENAAAAAVAPSRDPAAIAPEAAARVLHEFFARTARYAPRLVLVLVGGKADALQSQLAQAAREHGAIIIDGKPLLTDRAAQTGLSMHVSPQDGHLNGLAFATLAGAVAPAIESRAARAR